MNVICHNQIPVDVSCSMINTIGRKLMLWFYSKRIKSDIQIGRMCVSTHTKLVWCIKNIGGTVGRNAAQRGSMWQCVNEFDEAIKINY